MERVVPRKIVEVLPSGAELTWTEDDDEPTRDAPIGTVRVVEVLPDGRRRFVEVLPGGAELGWVEDVAGGDDPPAEAAT